MTDSAVVGEPFRIGACLSKSISAFFSNFISFNILGLLVVIPGVVLVLLLFGGTYFSLFTYDPSTGAPAPELGATFGLAFLGTFLIMVVWQYLLTGAIVYGAVQYLNGEKVSLTGSLMQMLRRFAPVALVAIVSTVLVWIGMILLVIPGIIIAIMLCVAIPVVMVEGPGTMASLSRSRALTKGSRWSLFGVFLVAGVGSAVATAVVSTVVNLVLPVSDTGLIIGTVVDFALQLFTTVFMAVVLAVVYHDLRVAKEGVSTAQLAAVFD